MITSRTSDTIHRRRLQIAPTSFVAAAFTLTAAGCGDPDPGRRPGRCRCRRPPAITVSAQATALGTVLVDGQGRTVYQFANDKNNMSTCTAACAVNWPYVPAPDSLPMSLPGVTGTLGTTTRDDGHRQLTVAGHPLYTFVGDSTPGQTNGQGLNLNGGVWTVVSPAGAALTNPARPAPQHKTPICTRLLRTARPTDRRRCHDNRSTHPQFVLMPAGQMSPLSAKTSRSISRKPAPAADPAHEPKSRMGVPADQRGHRRAVRPVPLRPLLPGRRASAARRQHPPSWIGRITS